VQREAARGNTSVTATFSSLHVLFRVYGKTNTVPLVWLAAYSLAVPNSSIM